MALKKHLITIAGCGPGGLEYVTPAARSAIEQAQVLAGATRLLDLFPKSRARHIVIGANVEAGLDQIETERGRRVTVLVTGDPGICSLATPVIKRFGLTSCTVIPGISSIQTAFARAGTHWLDARIINAHSDIPAIAPATLTGLPKLAVLAGHPRSAGWLNEVAATLGNRYRIVVCQDLTLPGERVREVTPAGLKKLKMPGHYVILWLRKEVNA